MLRTVIVASLLAVALGVGDMAYWIKQATEGKSSIECGIMCKGVYGTGGWGRSGSVCTCNGEGGGKAKVTFSCKTSRPYSGCTGSQTGGSATQPAPVAQQDPSGLPAFMVACAKKAEGKYAQRDGDVTSQKVKANVGDAQCSDLAMGCLRNADKLGFNAGDGKRGHVAGMCSGWAWSHDTVPYQNAKAGDIAQFSSWQEKKGYKGHSTGCKHTAVIVKDFDPATGGLEMLDQNPSPVSKTVYHPRASDGWFKKGKLIVYRPKSVLLAGLPAPVGGAPVAVPVAAPVAAPAAACKDDHAGLVAEAKRQNENGITGCADTKEYCHHSEYGPVVRKYCPKTCGVCTSRLYDNDADDGYSNYVKELQKQGDVNDESKMPALMLGAVAAAAMVVGMLGFGIWRKVQSSTRARHVALTQNLSEEQDIELTDDAGLE